jgi:diacylglycerol kinase (ATP)
MTSGQLDPQRWIAILNPAAGRGRARARWPAIARELAAAGVQVELRETTCDRDATRLAREALQRGARRFLAAGGDGTLHEIANGLLGAGTRCTLAVAPIGTGNDWARGLGIPADPVSLARTIARGRTLALDAGRIEFTTADGSDSRYFLNVAGAGYDAWVLERLPSTGPHGLAYLAGLLRGLWQYRSPRFELAAGDGSPQPGRFRVAAPLFAAFAAIGRYCGGGMRMAPAADPTDGLLDLVAIPCLTPWETVRRLPKLYSGSLHEDPLVRFGRSTVLTIAAAPPARVEADGQLLGHTPARIELVPRAFDAIVPAQENDR